MGWQQEIKTKQTRHEQELLTKKGPSEQNEQTRTKRDKDWSGGTQLTDMRRGT